jgi:hypothetical protein
MRLRSKLHGHKPPLFATYFVENQLFNRGLFLKMPA